MRAIGEPFTPAECEAFVAFARSCVGARWRHQGRSLAAMDCGGLLALSLRAVGRVPADPPAYGREPKDQHLEKVLQNNFGDPLPKSQMRAADVAIMRFRGAASHVGIVSSYPNGGFALIHAFAQMKKVVEHRIDSEWLDNIVEVYRP